MARFASIKKERRIQCEIRLRFGLWMVLSIVPRKQSIGEFSDKVTECARHGTLVHNVEYLKSLIYKSQICRPRPCLDCLSRNRGEENRQPKGDVRRVVPPLYCQLLYFGLGLNIPRSEKMVQNICLMNCLDDLNRRFFATLCEHGQLSGMFLVVGAFLFFQEEQIE